MKTGMLLRYENKWVALNKRRTRIISYASSISSLLRKLSRTEKKKVIIHYVMPFDGALSP